MTKGPSVQTRLVLGARNDPLEHEADEIADQVVRAMEPARTEGEATPRVQRKCTLCIQGDEFDAVQRKCAACSVEDDYGMIQRKDQPSSSVASAALRPDLAARIAAHHSQGRPLPETSRALFEAKMGHNFSRVRLHDDATSFALNRELRSRAFTVGHDVYFAHGEFQPHSIRGRRLLAHELVHTVQQTPATLRRAPASETAEPADPDAELSENRRSDEAAGLRRWLQHIATDGRLDRWLVRLRSKRLVALLRSRARRVRRALDLRLVGPTEPLYRKLREFDALASAPVTPTAVEPQSTLEGGASDAAMKPEPEPAIEEEALAPTYVPFERQRRRPKDLCEGSKTFSETEKKALHAAIESAMTAAVNASNRLRNPAMHDENERVLEFFFGKKRSIRLKQVVDKIESMDSLMAQMWIYRPEGNETRSVIVCSREEARPYAELNPRTRILTVFRKFIVALTAEQQIQTILHEAAHEGAHMDTEARIDTRLFRALGWLSPGHAARNADTWGALVYFLGRADMKYDLENVLAKTFFMPLSLRVEGPGAERVEAIAAEAVLGVAGANLYALAELLRQAYGDTDIIAQAASDDAERHLCKVGESKCELTLRHEVYNDALDFRDALKAVRAVRISPDARPWRLENQMLLVDSASAFQVRGDRAAFVRPQAHRLVQDCAVSFPALARMVSTPAGLDALKRLIRVAAERDPNMLTEILLGKE